jgi:hypothetical protein
MSKNLNSSFDTVGVVNPDLNGSDTSDLNGIVVIFGLINLDLNGSAASDLNSSFDTVGLANPDLNGTIVIFGLANPDLNGSHRYQGLNNPDLHGSTASDLQFLDMKLRPFTLLILWYPRLLSRRSISIFGNDTSI